MKKNTQKKSNRKIYLWLILAFVLGGVSGAILHANKNVFLAPKALCSGEVEPDKNGCCPGEVYTNMADLGYNCCPEGGGDCYPPLK